MNYEFADILLPLPLPQHLSLLTYRVGDDPSLSELSEGDGVAVPMGQHSDHYYTGIVWRLHNEKPNVDRIKTIIKRLYSNELLSEKHRKFWEWLSEYYLASLGDVMRVALPALINPKAADEEAFIMSEYQPKEELYISHSELNRLREAAEKIAKRSPKQLQALQQIIDIEDGKRCHNGEIPRRLLQCELSTLNALATKGLIQINRRTAAIESRGEINFVLPNLSEHQREALGTVEEGFKERHCVLLHGVTGSGKTELYIHLIAKELSEGRDVMMLVPEIALTTQLVERLTLIFGSRVTPYHSKIKPHLRTETFMQLTRRRDDDAGRFIVGARSAIFLPLSRLGLIIIDEEHDPSYKQNDPAPLYNARDAAHILASLHNAKLLLGSATPSLESWTNATTGKFAMAKLTERYNNATLPKITISDSYRAGKRRERRGHFNLDLVRAMESRLERGEQTMLFQNRRGFAPYIECSECSWVAKCPNCNVSLTLHKAGQSLVCHYCNHTEPIPQKCPNCAVSELRPMGFGTEKIEEQIGEILPTARTVRLDRDTATSQTAFDRIVGSFASGESDVMVGTQMIAKGFDFSKVTLVGILNADNMLNASDFRAEERAFSLMLQVAGRAGRRPDREGEVIVQSSQPDHRTLRFVQEGDYEAMARTLLYERDAYFYPPYSRIIMVTLKDQNKPRLNRGAAMLAQMLRGRFGGRVKGAVAPPVDRIGREWIMSIMLKIESGSSSKRARMLIREVESEWLKLEDFRNIKKSYNVDPQ